MAETLLTASRILLFGRVLGDLTLNYGDDAGSDVPDDRDAPPVRFGNKSFIEEQIKAFFGNDKRKARFARIYAFAYEGHQYDMAKPAIFLVHGPGTDAEGLWRQPGVPDPATGALPQRLLRAPGGADRVGVATTSSSFAQDMRIWAYDKSDFTIRLDSETGPFEQVLLEAELNADRTRTYFAGSKVRLRGPSRGGSSMD